MRPILVFVAASAAFCFVNATTFTSLGVALYAMSAELHWSQAAAGFSFSLLGLACGLASPLPMLVVLRVGGRATLCLGGLLLASGFALASASPGIGSFYAAMLLVGAGYTFAGNIPAIFLLSDWFTRRTAPVIGLYMMSGALGSTAGPPLVAWLVTLAGGWRGLWRVLALGAVGVALLCLALVRDPPVTQAASGTVGRQTLWRAMRTRAFLLVAGAVAMTMTALTTIDSIAMPLLSGYGTGPAAIPFVLSALALVDALTRGVAGRLCERFAPGRLLGAGLAFQAAGCLALIVAVSPPLQYGAALLDGIGCGLAFVASSLVLLQEFGQRAGSELLSAVWLISTLAAAGPLAAGLVADRTGSFAPILVLYAIMLLGLGWALSVAPRAARSTA